MAFYKKPTDDGEEPASSSSALNKVSLLKVILLGDGGVGKTALMTRFIHNRFDAKTYNTIGVEFLNKEVLVDGRRFTLQIWDTAGQERFKSLRTPFYRGCDICMLVYAIDDRKSFDNVRIWKNEFMHYSQLNDTKTANHFPFVLIGNKSDLADRQTVDSDEAERLCTSDLNRCSYFTCSAKGASQVDEAFVAGVRQYMVAESELRENVCEVDTVQLQGPDLFPPALEAYWQNQNCW